MFLNRLPSWQGVLLKKTGGNPLAPTAVELGRRREEKQVRWRRVQSLYSLCWLSSKWAHQQCQKKKMMVDGQWLWFTMGRINKPVEWMTQGVGHCWCEMYWDYLIRQILHAQWKLQGIHSVTSILYYFNLFPSQAATWGISIVHTKRFRLQISWYFCAAGFKCGFVSGLEFMQREWHNERLLHMSGSNSIKCPLVHDDKEREKKEIAKERKAERTKDFQWALSNTFPFPFKALYWCSAKLSPSGQVKILINQILTSRLSAVDPTSVLHHFANHLGSTWRVATVATGHHWTSGVSSKKPREAQAQQG